MRDEYKTLDEDTQRAVDVVIKEAKTARGIVSHEYGHTGDVYAYPGQADEIHWGVNGGAHGYCIARGIRNV